jgi:hypothetical protein
MGRRLRLERSRVVDLRHPGSPEADLNRIDRRPAASGEQCQRGDGKCPGREARAAQTLSNREMEA